MAYKNLAHFIQILEENNELTVITEAVSTNLEITEITDRFSKLPNGGKALLFKNTGYNFPVLTNAFGSEKRICLSLGVENLSQISTEIEDLLKNITSPKNTIFDKLKTLPQLGKIASWMPKIIKGKGSCQQVVDFEPDLNKLPILNCWTADGGKFITLPCVVTRDPKTKIRNVGMYRMQIFDKNTTGMHWHLHKTGARHYNEYKQKGEKMPVTVFLGGDPAYTYSATAPLPDNIDEFMLAGFLRKKKVELVKCITNDLEVPIDADFVIEGYVDTKEELAWEGPFGDHTGFYSLADWYPKFHVTCITHKKDAIYPTTIVGIPPQEDAYIGLATEKIFLAPIQLTMLPEMLDMTLPFAGVAHNLTIVKIDKTFRGQAQKVMNSLWGAGQMMFNKTLIIANKTENIHNYKELAQKISQNVNPSTDIYFSSGPSDVLDHSVQEFAYGSKMCIDTTNLKENVLIFSNLKLDLEKIKIENLEIVNCNFSLLNDEISVAVISVKFGFNFSAITEKLFNIENMEKVKFVVFVDDAVQISNIFDVVWVTGNNIDPTRDTIIKKTETLSSIYIDATSKIYKNTFKRQWPNPVVMNKETIKLVDEKWEKYFNQTFIESPSKKYSKLLIGEGAIVQK
jgi:4-hydroxy-3-polyprenylbenzoate decarboxylase